MADGATIQRDVMGATTSSDIGNEAAAHLLRIAQPKLEVGPAGDRYEQEADSVADRVVEVLRRARAGAQAATDQSEEPVATRPLVRRIGRVQRRAVVGAAGGAVEQGVEQQINSARGGGSKLPDNVRGPMESAFGSSFDDVKVHTGGQSDQLNDSISAKAFTVGSDIFFKGGLPDTSAASGQQLIAHELTHVVQQRVQAMPIRRAFFDDVMVFFGIKTPEEIRQGALSSLDKAKWNQTIADDSLMKNIASNISTKDFIEASKVVAAPFKTLIDMAVKYWSPVSLADLEHSISTATAEEKAAVCSDEALLTKVEGALGKDAYLTFVTRLGMHRPPTTSELGEGGKEHTAPAKADEIIRDKMSAYVTEAVKKGRKVEGQVGIVAGADWDRAGVAHYGSQVWFNASPTPKRDAINGFVDGTGRVWVERNSGNPGTVIHEGLHKYSDSAVLKTLGFNTNEGMTEYFTRLICADLGIIRGNYANNHDLITALATTVTTKEVIASTYFDGNIYGLRVAFIKHRADVKADAPELAAKIWDSFVSQMNDGQWAKALSCINDELDSEKLSNF